MTAATKIEWADSTFNPWIGCTKISPACDHCYAEAQMDTRMGRVEWGAGKARSRTSAANWKQPLRWNAEAFYECEVCGWRGTTKYGSAVCCDVPAKPARRRVFCASLADVFDNEVDWQWRADLFELIAATPKLDWLILTKRIGNAAPMISFTTGVIEGRGWIGEEYMRKVHGQVLVQPVWPYPNVSLGITICNQVEAERDIPKLLATPAAKRFLSIEPMLGPVYLFNASPIECDHEYARQCPDTGAWECSACENRTPLEHFEDRLHWVIAGGESGPNARPSHPEWFRVLRDDCAAAGLPYMHKQNGEWVSVSEVAGPGIHHHFPDGATVRRVGKHAAGRLLDGVEHNGVPT